MACSSEPSGARVGIWSHPLPVPAPVVNSCAVVAFAVGGAAGATISVALVGGGGAVVPVHPVEVPLVGGGSAVVPFPPVELLLRGVAEAAMRAGPVCWFGAVVSFPVGEVVILIFVGDARGVCWVRPGCLGAVMRGAADRRGYCSCWCGLRCCYCWWWYCHCCLCMLLLIAVAPS